MAQDDVEELRRQVAELAEVVRRQGEALAVLERFRFFQIQFNREFELLRQAVGILDVTVGALVRQAGGGDARRATAHRSTDPLPRETTTPL
jgi:hypothetical protein